MPPKPKKRSIRERIFDETPSRPMAEAFGKQNAVPYSKIENEVRHVEDELKIHKVIIILIVLMIIILLIAMGFGII